MFFLLFFFSFFFFSFIFSFSVLFYAPPVHSEHDKKLNRELAWRRVQEKAAINAKSLGMNDRYTQLMAEVKAPVVVDEIEYVEDLNFDEAAVSPLESFQVSQTMK